MQIFIENRGNGNEYSFLFLPTVCLCDKYITIKISLSEKHLHKTISNILLERFSPFIAREITHAHKGILLR